MTGPPRRYRVVEDWTASYRDPIRLAAGAPLTLTGRTERWEGYLWLWARCGDGREGWLPDSLVVHGPGGWHAREAYDAMELDCRTGQVLTGTARVQGWVRCRSASGAAGWVPARNLRPLDGPARDDG